MRRILLRSTPALLALTAACAGARPPQSVPKPAVSKAVVRVEDRWLMLRLARPKGVPPSGPLVFYVTGDGGWRGKDLDTWRHLEAWGHPAAGVSAPDYLDHLRGGAESLPPHRLAHDLVDMMAAAREHLGLPPDARVVLVGVSRGADLVVVAAADPLVRARLAGVLAVALTDEEEYVRRRPHHLFGRRLSSRETVPLEMVRPYEFIDQIQVPMSLIQSTNDEYVPADRARQQFGPESSTRRFHAISSRNHSFSDVRDTLYLTMRSSLAWLLEASAEPLTTGGRP